MPRFVSAKMKQDYYDAYIHYGTFDKAANALGVQRHRIVRAVYSIQNRCHQCTKPLDRKGALCTLCIKDLSKRAKSTYISLKKQGLCSRCHKPVNQPGYARCDSCNKHMAITNRKKHDTRAKAGVCIYCGQPSCQENPRYCQRHLLMARESGRKDRSHSYFDGNLDAVLLRDSSTCQICGATDLRIEVHHIDFNEKNNVMNNLIVLCRICHAAITFLSKSKDPDAIFCFFKSGHI